MKLSERIWFSIICIFAPMRSEALPLRGQLLYHVFEEKGIRLTSSEDVIRIFCNFGAILSFGLALSALAFPYPNVDREARAVMEIFGWAFLLSGYIITVDSGNAVKCYRDIARKLYLHPLKLQKYSDAWVRGRACTILCTMAHLHQDRQKLYSKGSPEFERTYQAFSNTFEVFKSFRLIPQDIDWTPYFDGSAKLRC